MGNIQFHRNQQQFETQKTYTNYVVGWTQIQNDCLMLLFSVIDVSCIDANKLAFFSNSQRGALTLLLSDSWRREMSAVLKTCSSENIFPPKTTLTQCPHTMKQLSPIQKYIILSSAACTQVQSYNCQRMS